MWEQGQADGQVGYSVSLQYMELEEAVPSAASQIFQASLYVLLTHCFFRDVNNASQLSDSVVPTWTYETVFCRYHISFTTYCFYQRNWSVPKFSRSQRSFLFRAKVVGPKLPSASQGCPLALDHCSIPASHPLFSYNFFLCLFVPLITTHFKCRYRTLP